MGKLREKDLEGESLSLFRTMEMELSRWGSWRRKQFRGLGYPASTVEHRLMCGQILGDGNSKHSPKCGIPNSVFFSDPPYPFLATLNLRIEYFLRSTDPELVIRFKIIENTFFCQDGIREISNKLSISRHKVRNELSLGIAMLSGMFCRELLGEDTD